MEKNNFIVIEGIHKNPNNIDTIEENTKKIYGPFDQNKAELMAKGLIQKNVDNFYHRAWVVENNIEINNICEECSKKDISVKQNLVMHGYKICNSCNLSKTIFPI
ncbi:hypothetical protein OAN27_00660 [Pelagibacteraceae bacterium]|nr:hypothetical protein [Pelagibacteraceae bacterium]